MNIENKTTLLKEEKKMTFQTFVDLLQWICIISISFAKENKLK
jgi:hypothetical protein